MTIPAIFGVAAGAAFFVPLFLVWWLPGHREAVALTRRHLRSASATHRQRQVNRV